jgi:cyclopropane-fatty-acyl-phospholipid synthase
VEQATVIDVRRLVDRVIDSGRLPDALLRTVIRGLLRARRVRGLEEPTVLGARLWDGPVTVATDAANRQHYEVPPEVFELMLGARMKYSCAWWPSGVTDLDTAEERMLELTCRRARLEDGQDILELGCGWGSLSLWMAQHYPSSRIVTVSNSASQRRWILERASEQGLRNLTVLTADVGRLGVDEHVDIVGPARFDRIVSVEMFEHVRNHRELGRRIARWLRPGGELFVHVFAHRDRAYLFEIGGSGDWMARNFFTGGMMPSEDWLPSAIDALTHRQTWRVDGRDYARTLDAWRRRIDAHHAALAAALSVGATAQEGERRLARWRTFMIACEELFAFDRGREWGVVHHRFSRP